MLCQVEVKWWKMDMFNSKMNCASSLKTPALSTFVIGDVMLLRFNVHPRTGAGWRMDAATSFLYLQSLT